MQQQWNSYAIGRSGSTKLSLDTYLGLYTAFINPTLTYLPNGAATRPAAARIPLR